MLQDNSIKKMLDKVYTYAWVILLEMNYRCGISVTDLTLTS